ncbi:MAG: hypothetical protein OD918_10185 [Gammaproteobacteria bacterium]
MSDKYTVSNDSKYRVAFDLMGRIASMETSNAHHASGSTSPHDRKYYLTLFEQCRRVVIHGKSATDVLGADVDPSR